MRLPLVGVEEVHVREVDPAFATAEPVGQVLAVGRRDGALDDRVVAQPQANGARPGVRALRRRAVDHRTYPRGGGCTALIRVLARTCAP